MDGIYDVVYEDQAITAERSSGSSYRYIDFDEPAIVDSSSNAELSVSYISGGPVLSFETSRVAVAGSPDIDPAGCADRIRLSPANTTQQPSRDLTMCLLTDGTGGVGQVSAQKMVVVTVTSVDANGAVFLEATSWNTPS